MCAAWMSVEAGCVSSLFSTNADPYDQVVIPVDDQKDEEQMEPFQKIGPSKCWGGGGTSPVCYTRGR